MTLRRTEGFNEIQPVAPCCRSQAAAPDRAARLFSAPASTGRTLAHQVGLLIMASAMKYRDVSLTAKPPGWIIQTEQTPDGPTLCWYAGVSSFKMACGRVLLPVWLVFWAVGWCAVFNQIVTGSSRELAWVWLAMWTLGGAWAFLAALAHWQPTIPEAVLLAKEHFGYSPGRAPAPQHFVGYDASLGKALAHVCSAPARIVIPKPELPKFELERIGERQRLSFRHGLEQVEIGAVLSQAEREWLYLLLEQWRTESKSTAEQPGDTSPNRTATTSELIQDRGRSTSASPSQSSPTCPPASRCG
jgi:hypothetical protein